MLMAQHVHSRVLLCAAVSCGAVLYCALLCRVVLWCAVLRFSSQAVESTSSSADVSATRTEFDHSHRGSFGRPASEERTHDVNVAVVGLKPPPPPPIPPPPFIFPAVSSPSPQHAPQVDDVVVPPLPDLSHLSLAERTKRISVAIVATRHAMRVAFQESSLGNAIAQKYEKVLVQQLRALAAQLKEAHVQFRAQARGLAIKRRRERLEQQYYRRYARLQKRLQTLQSSHKSAVRALERQMTDLEKRFRAEKAQLQSREQRWFARAREQLAALQLQLHPQVLEILARVDSLAEDTLFKAFAVRVTADARTRTPAHAPPSPPASAAGGAVPAAAAATAGSTVRRASLGHGQPRGEGRSDAHGDGDGDGEGQSLRERELTLGSQSTSDSDSGAGHAASMATDAQRRRKTAKTKMGVRRASTAEKKRRRRRHVQAAKLEGPKISESKLYAQFRTPTPSLDARRKYRRLQRAIRMKRGELRRAHELYSLHSQHVVPWSSGRTRKGQHQRNHDQVAAHARKVKAMRSQVNRLKRELRHLERRARRVKALMHSQRKEARLMKRLARVRAVLDKRGRALGQQERDLTLRASHGDKAAEQKRVRVHNKLQHISATRRREEHRVGRALQEIRTHRERQVRAKLKKLILKAMSGDAAAQKRLEKIKHIAHRYKSKLQRRRAQQQQPPQHAQLSLKRSVKGGARH